MQDGRSLQAWVWVVAVVGYLIVPYSAGVLGVGLSLGGALGGMADEAERTAGAAAGFGVFVVPVLAWVISLALHHERRAHGQRALDGVVLNWIGGLLVACLAVTVFGAYGMPRVNEYLERREQASIEDGAGLSEGDPQPSARPTEYTSAQVAAEAADKAMGLLRNDSWENLDLTDATSSEAMAEAIGGSLPDPTTVHPLPLTYDADVAAHEGTPSHPHGGRVNLRVTVHLTMDRGEVRGGVTDSSTTTDHESCWGMRVHTSVGITDVQQIDCTSADSIGELPVLKVPSPDMVRALRSTAALDEGIAAKDAQHALRDALQDDDLVVARAGGALVIALEVHGSCAVVVREPGQEPFEFLGYRHPAQRACTPELYTDAPGVRAAGRVP